MRNFFAEGFQAFWKGERCPPEATPEQAAEWKRGHDLAKHECMMEEFRLDR